MVRLADWPQIGQCYIHPDHVGKIKFWRHGEWRQACEKCVERGTPLEVVIKDGRIMGPLSDSTDVENKKKANEAHDLLMVKLRILGRQTVNAGDALMQIALGINTAGGTIHEDEMKEIAKRAITANGLLAEEAE